MERSSGLRSQRDLAAFLIENQLQESNLFENFPAMIWKSNSEGKFNYFNKSWLEFRGVKYEEENGNGWLNAVHPDDKDKVVSIYVGSFNEHKDFEIEYRILNKDGKYRRIVNIGRPAKDTNGNFIGYIGVCYDITDRKHTEDVLKEKTQLLENILFNLPLVVMEIDEEGLVLEMRGKGINNISLMDNHHIGENIFNLFPQHSDRLKECLQGKEVSFVTQFEVDEQQHFFYNNFFFNHAKGRGAIGLAFDITEQKIAEQQLKDKKQILDGVVNNIPVIIRRINELGEITESIGLGLQKIGLQENEERGLNIFEENPNYRSYIQKGLSGSKVQLLESNNKSGKEVFFDTYIFPDSIQTKGAISFSLDITDQRQAEEIIRELNESLKYAFEGIALVGKKGKFITVNKSKANILGYYTNELLGMDWKKTIHPEDIILAENAYQKMLHDGKVSFEVRGIRKDGSIIYKEMTMVSNIDKFGEFKGHYSFLRDITARKESEEKLRKLNVDLEQIVNERTEQLSSRNDELKQKNEELLKINTDLDNFVYTASHDLKAPISNIEGLMTALRRDLQSHITDEVQMMFGMIDTSIARFKATINDLTEITKIQKNIDSDEEQNNLMELVEEICLAMQDEIAESSAEIRTDFKIKKINFSKKNLRSIIYNLLNNAIKYRSTDRTPKVFLSSEITQDKYILIKVRDNGLGIKMDQKDKIFTMFKRFHDHVDGTGIGLYIVKRIIDNSGGKIEVESIPEEGTEFRVYFKP